MVDIVHRFALSHIDDIGKGNEIALLCALCFAWVLRGEREIENLVEYLCGGELPVETESTCHTETAAHLAAHLGGDTQRGPVAIGDIDRFDILVVDLEKEFLGAVCGLGVCYGGMATDDVLRFERFTPTERDVGHLIKGSGTANIEPFGELLARKLLQADALRHDLQLR